MKTMKLSVVHSNLIVQNGLMLFLILAMNIRHNSLSLLLVSLLAGYLLGTLKDPSHSLCFARLEDDISQPFSHMD